MSLRPQRNEVFIMILRKAILVIVMFITAMVNFTTVEAVETTPYVYYGTIENFIKKINYQLDTAWGGEYSNCKLYNPTYQNMQWFGGGYVGEVTIATISERELPGNLHLLPASTIKFHSTLDNSAIYKIEINNISGDAKVNEKMGAILAATILATDVPSDTFKQFAESLFKWVNSGKSLPTSKTFKLWHPQMGRYIVVKWKIDSKGSQEIMIDGKFS